MLSQFLAKTFPFSEDQKNPTDLLSSLHSLLGVFGPMLNMIHIAFLLSVLIL